MVELGDQVCKGMSQSKDLATLGLRQLPRRHVGPTHVLHRRLGHPHRRLFCSILGSPNSSLSCAACVTIPVRLLPVGSPGASTASLTPLVHLDLEANQPLPTLLRHQSMQLELNHG